MIFYGTKATGLKSVQIPNCTCKHCEQIATHNVAVFGKYAYLYWIPMFPIGKVAVAECTACKKTIPREEFPTQLANKYDEVKGDIKTPIWYWSGIGIILALVGFFQIKDATKEIDPRLAYMKQDMAQMYVNPEVEVDSIAAKVAALMQVVIVEEMEPQYFEYLTLVDGDKVMFMLKIPNLHDVTSSERPEIFEMVEMVLDNSADLADKKKYIAITDVDDLMLYKVGEETKNSSEINTGAIFDFYGPKPEEAG